MTRKFLHVLIVVTFIGSLVTPFPQAHADSLLGLPEPGSMVNLSPAYEPILIKGLKIHPENPFLFDFIIDTGNDMGAIGNRPYMKNESQKLIKYFLASMTIPEKDLWVNLSPYEKNRMIASNLGQTEMGRDMLAQDYMLKQLTASLIYPEKNLGKNFWDQVYSKAQQEYGTTQIPVNTFNKVWIVADRADIYEHDNTAYIIGAHLKVMLEEDYLALQKNHGQLGDMPLAVSPSSLASQIIRSIIIPAITKEVNSGKNFALLRQMFYSMILAAWYKRAFKNAILSQVYVNQSLVKVGINQEDIRINEKILNRYLHAYKKGVFNYIKDDIVQSSGDPVFRKYFSGGLELAVDHAMRILSNLPQGISLPYGSFIAQANTFPAKLNMPMRERPFKDSAMMNKPHEYTLKTAQNYLASLIHNPEYANKDFIGLMRMNVPKGNLLIVPFHESMARNPENSLWASNENEWITIKWSWGPNGYLKSLEFVSPTVINPLHTYSPRMRNFVNGQLSNHILDEPYQIRIHDELIEFARLIDGVVPQGQDISVKVSLVSIPELRKSLTSIRQLSQLTLIQTNHVSKTQVNSFELLNNRTNGGIDLNANQMIMRIHKDTKVNLGFLEQSLISRIRSEGFDGLDFKIRSILPVKNLPVFLGLEG